MLLAISPCYYFIKSINSDITKQNTIMASRKILFIYAILISLLFGCTKDDSRDVALAGEWIGNDVHQIMTSGDQTSNGSFVYVKEFRPRYIFNSDGTGTKYSFDEPDVSVQKEITYSISGDQITIIEDGESTSSIFSIQNYNSIARLIITTKFEEPNGVKIEIREHYIRK